MSDKTAANRCTNLTCCVYVRPRSRSRDSGDENDNIQERHFRPHFLQAPGDLIVQEGRLCRMDCKVNSRLAALQLVPTRPNSPAC